MSIQNPGCRFIAPFFMYKLKPGNNTNSSEEWMDKQTGTPNNVYYSVIKIK